MEQVRLLNATCAHWEEEYFKSGRENDELREQLRGSISERETLTARIAKMVKICEESIEVVDIAHARIVELEAAVARLTTEKAAFQDWFQNAEQARAVAIAERDRQSERAAQFERDLEASEVQRAELLKSREQAIHDIEALPPECELISLVRMNDQAISKRAVLSILRGSNG